jgi:hypothetical protein
LNSLISRDSIIEQVLFTYHESMSEQVLSQLSVLRRPAAVSKHELQFVDGGALG